MGAWGHQTFEDDSALDLIDEWITSGQSTDDLAQTLKLALSDDEMDYDQGQDVSVIAAVVDFVLLPGRAQNAEYAELSEDQAGLDVWLDTLSPQALRALLPTLMTALDKLVSPASELAELWSENQTDGPLWVAYLRERQSRLRGLLVD